MANETAVKLSILAPDTMLINDASNIMTASKLIDEITRLGEQQLLSHKWQVAEPLSIGCNAEEMIQTHVENIVCDAEIVDDEELYSLLLEALKPCAPEIQAILDKATADLDTRYWIGTQQQVEIDVEVAIDREDEAKHIRWLNLLDEHNINYGLDHEGISYHSAEDLQRARELAKEHGFEDFVSMKEQTPCQN